MIQLDPDLEVRPTSATAESAPARVAWAERIPSVRTLEKFLLAAQKAVRLRGEVSVLLTSDKAIRRLNRDFRGKNQATDVLSFPALMAGVGPQAEQMAGDLAISVDTARKQAAEQGHALACELKVLLLHGLLHLAGYDHEADEGQMARRERTLRERLRLPVGLIERAGKPESAKKAPAKKAAVKKVAITKSPVKKAAVKKTAAKKLVVKKKTQVAKAGR
jgi:probable rRNA maturation factor